jgi:hypothetical protein
MRFGKATALDALQQFDSVGLGNPQLRDDNVKSLFLQVIEGLPTIRSRKRTVTLGPQVCREAIPIQLVRVNNQYSHFLMDVHHASRFSHDNTLKPIVAGALDTADIKGWQGLLEFRGGLGGGRSGGGRSGGALRIAVRETPFFGRWVARQPTPSLRVLRALSPPWANGLRTTRFCAIRLV